VRGKSWPRLLGFFIVELGEVVAYQGCPSPERALLSFVLPKESKQRKLAVLAIGQGHITGGCALFDSVHRSLRSLVLDYRAYSKWGHRSFAVVGAVVGSLIR